MIRSFRAPYFSSSLIVLSMLLAFPGRAMDFTNRADDSQRSASPARPAGTRDSQPGAAAAAAAASSAPQAAARVVKPRNHPQQQAMASEPGAAVDSGPRGKSQSQQSSAAAAAAPAARAQAPDGDDEIDFAQPLTDGLLVQVERSLERNPQNGRVLSQVVAKRNDETADYMLRLKAELLLHKYYAIGLGNWDVLLMAEAHPGVKSEMLCQARLNRANMWMLGHTDRQDPALLEHLTQMDGNNALSNDMQAQAKIRRFVLNNRMANNFAPVRNVAQNQGLSLSVQCEAQFWLTSMQAEIWKLSLTGQEADPKFEQIGSHPNTNPQLKFMVDYRQALKEPKTLKDRKTLWDLKKDVSLEFLETVPTSPYATPQMRVAAAAQANRLRALVKAEKFATDFSKNFRFPIYLRAGNNDIGGTQESQFAQCLTTGSGVDREAYDQFMNSLDIPNDEVFQLLVYASGWGLNNSLRHMSAASFALEMMSSGRKTVRTEEEAVQYWDKLHIPILKEIPRRQQISAETESRRKLFIAELKFKNFLGGTTDDDLFQEFVAIAENPKACRVARGRAVSYTLRMIKSGRKVFQTEEQKLQHWTRFRQISNEAELMIVREDVDKRTGKITDQAAYKFFTDIVGDKTSTPNTLAQADALRIKLLLEGRTKGILACITVPEALGLTRVHLGTQGLDPSIVDELKGYRVQLLAMQKAEEEALQVKEEAQRAAMERLDPQQRRTAIEAAINAEPGHHAGLREHIGWLQGQGTPNEKRAALVYLELFKGPQMRIVYLYFKARHEAEIAAAAAAAPQQ